MTTIYYIDITDGVITFDRDNVTKTGMHAPNAKQHFEKRGQVKPQPVPVRGWPFAKMYLTHGTEENGQAVAWI